MVIRKDIGIKYVEITIGTSQLWNSEKNNKIGVTIRNCKTPMAIYKALLFLCFNAETIWIIISTINIKMKMKKEGVNILSLKLSYSILK